MPRWGKRSVTRPARCSRSIEDATQAMPTMAAANRTTNAGSSGPIAQVVAYIRYWYSTYPRSPSAHRRARSEPRATNHAVASIAGTTSSSVTRSQPMPSATSRSALFA
jgi:hypothetical protein